MTAGDELFPGFDTRVVHLDDVEIFARTGGQGPALLLLHGYPESHLAWHKVAPTLAARFSLVIPDLRGYGRSGCPPSDGEHRTYAKRTMADDMLRLMASLGHGRFSAVGHDRGARVAYRLALDRPDIVERLVVIDIIPTLEQIRVERQASETRIVHWAFLAQPAPLPEALIGSDPAAWIEARFIRGTAARSTAAIDPRALESYRACFADPDRIHATCEDHRAGAGCDLADEELDRRLGRRIAAPTLLVWGKSGSLAGIADPLALWKPWCDRLQGAVVDSGHYVPEESPAALLEVIQPFLETPPERERDA